MEQYNPDGKVAGLGMQGLSSCLLFAQAATACGSELTADCLLEEAAAPEDWTAGGLHAPQTPGNEEPTQCFLILGLDEDGFSYNEEATAPTDGDLQLRPGERLPADRRLQRVRRPAAGGLTAPGARRHGGPPRHTVLGLCTAAIFALAASGLVLTYTTTGIFNFAHGAIGHARRLHATGSCTWTGAGRSRSPWRRSLLVLAPGLGLGIERVIMRGLADAPETVRIIVTISLLVALLGIGPWIWTPQELHRVPLLFPGERLEHLRRERHVPRPVRLRAGRRWWPSACGCCCTARRPASTCGPASTAGRWRCCTGPGPTAPPATAWAHRLLARRAGRGPDRAVDRSARPHRTSRC